MSLLLQDLVVTSITLAVAASAVVRVWRWTRDDRSMPCSNCQTCDNTQRQRSQR
jgi:hypothetical protein